MSIYYKILISLLCLAYLINPFDLLPEFIPLLGWIDDSILIGLLIYFLRYDRLPGFFQITNAFFRFGQEPPRGEGAREGGQEGFSTREEAKKRSGHFRGNDPNRNANRFGHGRKTPEEILGVSPWAPADEIQSAYRSAVQKYHPDKVAHLGPELQALAQEKFIEIQKAYEAIKPPRTRT